MIVNGKLIELDDMEILAVLLDSLGGKYTFSPTDIAKLHSNVDGATLSNNLDGTITFELRYKPDATLKENGIDLSKV